MNKLINYINFIREIKMNIEMYLKKINVAPQKVCDASYLSQLHENHLLHIPYENLDIIYKKPIELDTKRFFTKIIENKRGGFCYELSGLFHELLIALGFQSKLISGNVNDGQGGWVGEDVHVAGIVKIENKEYLTDVGFGDGIRKPILLSGEEMSDVSGIYKIFPVDNKYDLKRKNGDTWITLYRFSTEKKYLTDFQKACKYIQTDEKSPFVQRRIVTIATNEGRITLSENSLTLTKYGIKERKEFPEEKFSYILNKYFGIILK